MSLSKMSENDDLQAGQQEKAGQGSSHAQVARRQLLARSDHVPLVVQSSSGATSRQPFTSVWCISACVALQQRPHSH